MSVPSYTDLIQPGATQQSLNRLIGQMLKREHFQLVAATLATGDIWVADFDGQLADAYVQMTAVTGAGESMTYDILKNGASIMLGGTPVTVNSTNGLAKAKIDLWTAIDPAKRGFVKGDFLVVARVYTAGGTPTPIARQTVYLEPALNTSR